MLKSNVGTMERLARVIAGAALMGGWLLTMGTTLGWVLLVLGVYVLGTGLLGYCLLYSMMGITTSKANDA